MSVRLVLVRHTTPAVDAGICYGRLDLDLAHTATVDIQRCLQAIPPTDVVLASPSRRCIALARAIGQRDSVGVVEDSRLLELDFGSWEGRRWSEIPRAEFDAWASDVIGRAPGGGETARELWTRVESLYLEIPARSPGTVAIVSHHGPLRALAAMSEARALETIFSTFIPWGGVQTTSPIGSYPSGSPA